MQEDKAFLSYIKQHRHIGYGRMMQIISYEWYEVLKRENPDLPGMKESALVPGGCFVFLSEEQKKAYLAILEQDKESGMDY
jgi:hypothetical protein